MKTTKTVLTVLALLLFFSCRTLQQEPSFFQPESPAGARKVEIPPPSPPDEDLLGQSGPETRQEAQTAGSLLEDKFYDLDLQGGEIKDILLALVRDTEIGLVVAPGVGGQVPVMDLKNVTLKRILSFLLPPLNLEYSWDGSMLHVFPAPLLTRYFSLDYLSATRKGKRQVSFSTRSNEGGGSTGSSSGMGGVSGGAGGGAASGGGMNQSSSEITVDYENSLWKTFSESLQVLIFGSREGAVELAGSDESRNSTAYADAGGRTLIISPETGIVLIRAGRDELNRAADFIERFEGSAQRQVWIEAKIIEVNLFKGYQMGIDWGAVINRGNYYGTLNQRRTLTSPALGFNPGPVSDTDLTSTHGAFQIAFSNNVIDTILDALSRQGNIKVLANPRISTLNNEKAVIRVVREETFFNLQSEIAQGIGGAITAPTINVQIVPIGIVMDIIPQINQEGDIILSINPDISELLEVKRFEVQGAQATQPVIDRRSIDTVAKLKDGQSLVIAGIIKEKKQETIRGIPFLSKLPVIGAAFRRTEQRLEKTELVIFITPRVISGRRGDELSAEEMARIEAAVSPFHLGDTVGLKEGLQGEIRSLKPKKKERD